MKRLVFRKESIKAYLRAWPQKCMTYIKSVPGNLARGIKDPKQRLKWVKQIVIIFGGMMILLLLLFLLTWVGAFGSIPSHKTLLGIRQPEASKIYSADGKLMGKFYTKNRNNLNFHEIPPTFISGLIATEDSRFWTHSGIDLRSWARVFVKRLVLGQKSAGGGSTLSQQLAKNLFPRKNYFAASMLISKYREFIIASRLENAYSKEDLLTFYINTVPFGENIFGLDAAADRYFSKTADQMTIEECATLVGLLKATGYYNPNNNPERAMSRRNTVLSLMQQNDVIDSLALDSLSKLPVQLTYQRNTDSEGIALYFRNHLRPILLDWCEQHEKPNGESYNLNTDGLKIYTTIDFGMQQYAEEAVKDRMSRLQKTFDKQFDNWKLYEAPIQDAVKRSKRYLTLRETGMNEDQIMTTMNTAIPMKLWTWDGLIDTIASPMDSIRHDLKTLQASLIAINPKNGGVMAWVGGNDAQQFNIDYVLTPRHPGSAFKPILYATALEQGMDPCTYYTNQQITYENYEGWTPNNADGNYEGYYALTGALAKSINTIAVQLIFDVGIDNVIEKARRMGITGEMKRVPSLALGTAEVTLLELVSAYTTFLNSGSFRPYNFLTRIEDQDGNVLEEFKTPLTTGVFTPETSGMINQMMANVVNKGTAASIRYKEFGIRGALAGKTGTTQFNSDGIFIGMSPKFLAGTWVGCFDRRVSINSFRDGQGSKTALPIWGEFVKKLQADPVYNSYFYGTWPEGYEWIHDCPFTIEESELVELGVNPDVPRDSSYTGPRKFILKNNKRSKIGKLLNDIFGNKNKVSDDQ